MLSQSANLTSLAPAALEALESAKSTSEPAEPTPAVPGAFELSSDDYAVPEVLDEDMADK